MALDLQEIVEQLLDMGAFVKDLRELGANDALDFTAAVLRFIAANDLDDRVKEIILAAME